MEDEEKSKRNSKRIEKFILYHPLQTPLYAFLKECNESPLEKEILGCGTGGKRPSLALFYSYGYKTFGIDISSKQLELAHKFSRENGMNLGVMKGDICSIPFKNRSLSFVYSINSVCHLSKKDTAVALREMERVLKPGGLCCVNFCTVDDVMANEGEKVGEGEFLQELDWYPGIVKKGHICSYYEEKEPDKYFSDFEIIVELKRIVELPIYKEHPEGGGWQVGDVWYIARKEL